jgi:hypothetical protein
MASDKDQGTVTINLAPYLSNDKVTMTPAVIAGCSATFKLIAGYAFDLTPPAGASCPSNAIPYSVQDRTFCHFCQTGEYKNATGVCAPCPAGTYQDAFGSTTCKPCPVGFVCYSGTSVPYACQPGSSSPSSGDWQCKSCPVNTYSTRTLPATCTPCPQGTISVAGSSVCGVPWDM